MSTHIYRLPDTTPDAAKAALAELCRVTWSQVLAPEQGVMGRTNYRLLGPNAWGTVPLSGQLRIVGDVIVDDDFAPVNDCCLVLEVAPGIELTSEQARLAFETSLVAMANDLVLAIGEITGKGQELR